MFHMCVCGWEGTDPDRSIPIAPTPYALPIAHTDAAPYQTNNYQIKTGRQGAPLLLHVNHCVTRGPRPSHHQQPDLWMCMRGGWLLGARGSFV